MGKISFFILHFSRFVSKDMADSPHSMNREMAFKRKAYSIATKIELLDLYHKDQQKISNILSERHINPTTFSLWLRTEGKIRAHAQNTDITQMKRCRPSTLKFVDDGLYRWFLDIRASEPYRKINDEDLLITANRLLDKFVESGIIPAKRLPRVLDRFPPGKSVDSGIKPDTITLSSTPSTDTETDTSESSTFHLRTFKNLLDSYRGVRNSGSDCYIIVVIQLLFFHPQFRKFIVSIDPDFTYFPFNLSTAHQYFVTTDRQQVSLGSRMHLTPQNAYSRFATITSSEIKLFQQELSVHQKARLFKSYRALRYTFGRLSEPSAILSVTPTLKQSETPNRLSTSVLQKFEESLTKSPRIAQYTRTGILSLQANPQRFVLEYSSRFRVSPSISLSFFRNTYTDINGNSIPPGQQDPQEFLLLLLNTLTQCFYSFGLPLISRKLFWVNTVETFVCAQGHKVKQSDCGAYVISIPLNTSNLIQSLEKLHTEGHAVSSECAQCASMQSLERGEVVPCQSLLSFKQLPNTIFFMLERYMSGPHGTYKLTKRFTFPLDDVLDLSPYSTKPSISPTSPDYPTYCNYHRFRLAAVICHQGAISSGHYIAFIKERQTPFRWLVINDEGIMAVPISYMTDMLFSSETSSASTSSNVCGYLLCYERITPIDEWVFERNLLQKVCPSTSFSLYTYRNGDDITLKSGISLPYPTYYDLISSSSSSTPTEISEPPSDTEKPKSEGDSTSSSSTESTKSLLQSVASSRRLPCPTDSVNCDHRPPLQIHRSWIYRWKMRHGIRYRKFYGESGESDIVAGNLWVETELETLKKRYRIQDIFNADETGLFYKRLPSGGLTFKTEVLRGRRVSKSRITVLVAASSVGEKLPLLVIGRSKHTKELTGHTLSLQYLQNDSAWMTRDIFTDWLDSLNTRMVSSKRFIAMVVDNCSAHKVSKEFSNISLIYLPPSVTSTHQPCDAGIISLLKRKYHRLFLTILYRQRHTGTPISVDSISFLSVLQHLESAWSDIPAQHITNCFNHAWKKQDIKQILPIQLKEDTESKGELARFVDDNIANLSFPKENEYTLEPVSEKTIVSTIQEEIETRQSFPFQKTRLSHEPTPLQISQAAQVLLSGIQSGKLDSDETLASSLENIKELASRQEPSHLTGQRTLDQYFKKLHDEKELRKE